MGDLLFSISNLARKMGIEAESALRKANDKFTEALHGAGGGVRAARTKYPRRHARGDGGGVARGEEEGDVVGRQPLSRCHDPTGLPSATHDDTTTRRHDLLGFGLHRAGGSPCPAVTTPRSCLRQRTTTRRHDGTTSSWFFKGGRQPLLTLSRTTGLPSATHDDRTARRHDLLAWSSRVGRQPLPRCHEPRLAFGNARRHDGTTARLPLGSSQRAGRQPPAPLSRTHGLPSATHDDTTTRRHDLSLGLHGTAGDSHCPAVTHPTALPSATHDGTTARRHDFSSWSSRGGSRGTTASTPLTRPTAAFGNARRHDDTTARPLAWSSRAGDSPAPLSRPTACLRHARRHDDTTARLPLGPLVIHGRDDSPSHAGTNHGLPSATHDDRTARRHDLWILSWRIHSSGATATFPLSRTTGLPSATHDDRTARLHISYLQSRAVYSQGERQPLSRCDDAPDCLRQRTTTRRRDGTTSPLGPQVRGIGGRQPLSRCHEPGLPSATHDDRTARRHDFSFWILRGGAFLKRATAASSLSSNYGLPSASHQRQRFARARL